ncbi:IS21 family transposase [Candidatus Chloroploca asiatica]|nr:IS21 family transposase [Candidatus Chloroploca asiatica]
MDVRELLRHLRSISSDRAVARTLGLHRKTVLRYRIWARQQDLLSDTPLPALDELQDLVQRTLTSPPPPQTVSSVEPHRDLVVDLRARKVEVAAIHQRLTERGFTGSYDAVYRFVRQLEPRTPEATVRVERAPGEEAQVDFGAAGKLIDPVTGLLRTAWAFVMTLAFSRHQYVEFVFDQTIATWIRLHVNAFASFGGVPERVVCDNLKAAIVVALRDDPLVQQTYRECAEHYGFLIDPCRVATPEHKGKVESGVHYVKRNFLAGRASSRLPDANVAVREWCMTTAGERTHGTTFAQPRIQFETIERAALRPLPLPAYDLAIWKEATVARDCYVVFEKSFYSVPFRLIGQTVRVRGGSQRLQIYTTDYALVATHPRATAPGERHTHLDHLPPEKIPGLLQTRDGCRAAAQDIGPATAEVVETLLSDPALERLPTVGRLLRLREAAGDERLEAACVRALAFDDPRYQTIKGILDDGSEHAPLPEPAHAAPANTFARNAHELLGHLFGGVQWT